MKKEHLKHKLPAQQRKVMTWEPVQQRKAKNCNEKSFDGSKGTEESTFFIWGICGRSVLASKKSLPRVTSAV